MHNTITKIYNEILSKIDSVLCRLGLRTSVFGFEYPLKIKVRELLFSASVSDIYFGQILKSDGDAVVVLGDLFKQMFIKQLAQCPPDKASDFSLSERAS